MDWKQFEIAPKKLRTINITSLERQASEKELEAIRQQLEQLNKTLKEKQQ